MNSFKKSKNKYAVVFGAFIVVFLLITTACFRFYNSAQSTIRDENKNYLQEVSRKLGSNIDRILLDNHSALFTMAASVEKMSNLSINELQSLMEKQQTAWKYNNIMLIDESGRTYDLNNKEVSLNFDDAMRADILNGNKSISTSQIINNQEYIVFSVPLDHISVDNKVMVALAASYSPVEFVNTLSTESFNEQSYSQIVTASGTVVTKPSSPYAMKTGYNIFNSLQNAKLDEGKTLADINSDIKENKTGQVRFSYEDIDRYMVYTPINLGQWYLLTFVPASAVTEKSDALLNTMLLLCTLVAVVFAGLCLTLFFIFNSNRQRLERMAYVDDVTNGNSIQRFHELARDALNTNLDKNYAFIYTNIENFKVLNEQYGRQTCDSILKLFYEFISTKLIGFSCMGRLFADNFCILVEFENEELLAQYISNVQVDGSEYLQENKIGWALPCVEFGVLVIDNRELTFAQMADRAKLALKEESWVYGANKIAFYNDGVRRRLFREKQLGDRMEAALSNGEFHMYLQPKYRLSDERIGGAEALVRWISPDEGMVFPDEFIPLFERNGFVVDLDLWIFEQACRAQQAWKMQGLPIVKISVNCSRIHFRSPTFLQPYIQVAKKYDTELENIEIELTESVVFENTDRLIEIIDSIKDAGFGCSMDDFGSGYSSLNLIQNIPVDTLKLDKIFFRSNATDNSRTEAVITNIISMAKSLSMETVAEGVEERGQVEMLKRANCDYIQGYVFAKPMDLQAFEKLAFEDGHAMPIEH